MTVEDWGSIAARFAGSAGTLRIRQGEVVTVNAGDTIDMTLAGGTEVIAGVHYAAHVCPTVGAGIWVATDGADLFAIATIAPIGPAYAFVRRGATQPLDNNTSITVVWDTEEADAWDMNSPADGRLIVPASGLYSVSAAVEFASNATGYRSLQVLDTDGTVIAGDRKPAVSGTGTRCAVATHVQLTKGGSVRAQARQTSGSSLNVGGSGVYQGSMRVVWLGAA